MIRFIHTADIHFGMENYGKIDPVTGIHSRLLDFFKALNYCIDYALEKQVDFFLFAGDAYKTHHPSQTQQKMLLDCFLRLFKAGIPVIIVVGNHDHPISFGKAHTLDLFAALPVEGFYIFSKPGSFVLETKSGPVTIVGIPWPTRNSISLNELHKNKTATELTEYISQAVAHVISDYAQKIDATIPAVLASHLTVSTGVFSGSEKRAIYGNDPMLLPSQLAIEPFDYVALGHLHRYQDLNSSGYPSVVYSGSIERIDFGERKEEKGFCLVTIEEKNKTQHQFIPVPTRPFVQIEVTLDKDSLQTEQVLAAIKKHTIVDAIVKIIYYIPEGKKDLVDTKAIQQACSLCLELIAIIPIYATKRTQRNCDVNVAMDLPTLLDRYFTTKPELIDKKDMLIEKALLLWQEHKEKQDHDQQ